jgi:O-antigen ligase
VFAIKLSIIVATVYAIYFHSGGRLEVNADSPTLYGFIMVFYVFAIIIDVWTQGKKEKLFSIFIFILAMYSVVLSGTRIAWVIFVVLFFSAMLIWSIRGHLTKKSLLLILIALAVVTAFSMNNKSFIDRIDVAFQEIQISSVDKDSSGSVGLRLLMWSGGLTAFKQQPIIGYGYQNTGLEASRHVTGSYAKEFIKYQKMLHNDYVNSLVGFGILGLLALMALLFLPLTLFFKRLKADKECARSAIGVLFIIALSVFAITDSIYSHSVMRSFFIFFLGVLLPIARKEYV